MERALHADFAVDDVLLRYIADGGTEEVEGRIEIGAVIEHLPARERPPAVEGVEQGGLAGAAGPEDHHELAWLEHQADLVQKALRLTRGSIRDRLVEAAHLDADAPRRIDGIQGLAGEDKGKGGDGDAIAGMQSRLPGQPLPVDEGAVGAVEVLDHDTARIANQAGMLAGDQGRVDGVVAVRRAADGYDAGGVARAGGCRGGLGKPESRCLRLFTDDEVDLKQAGA